MQMLQGLINHVSLVVDQSASMFSKPVVEVFDKELLYLQRRSVELSQETRISLYLFSSRDCLKCLAFDMDVMRFKTLAGLWRPNGMTALIDAIERSTLDHQRIPQLYGDHAFLQYVITDGEENHSRSTAGNLGALLRKCPENWTTACLVPNIKGVHEAKKLGLHQDCISIWDTTKKDAVEKVGAQFSQTMDAYFTMRAKGVRGTTGLFTLDSSKLSVKDLKELPPQLYTIYPVYEEMPIRLLVEEHGQAYKLGTAYYQPTKPVEIQDHKSLLVRNVHSGKVYKGNNLRPLLGLPTQTTKVYPGSHKDWEIFVQSTSVNRKLYPGTNVLVTHSVL